MIEIQNLTKRFRRLDAVNDLSLTVPEGSAFALIGANGAGKTTTLKILMNMLAPDRGSATVLGVDSRRLSTADLQRIGYVSESQQMPGATRVDVFFDYLRPMYPAWDTGLETALRKQFRLPAATRIRSLSHGTVMKLKLACALSFRPRLLVLDEPLSGLDPLARDEVLEGLLSLAGETTILISSHELAEIETLLSHVAYLEQGRLRFSEPLADLSRRFREVRVTLREGDAIAGPAASSWTGMRRLGNVAQFVETAYDERTLGERVQQSFGAAVAGIEARAMSLREIFVALARETQSAAGGQA